MHNGRSRLLFLCTGNYYRSRFAAILFNVLAGEAGLDWTAYSRGVAVEMGNDNVGPISIHATRGLQARGIALPEPIRFPAPVQDHDMAGAQRVIALKESEHRPFIERCFPLWRDKVEYWSIHDLDLAPAESALAEIEDGVKRIIRRLAQLPGQEPTRLP